jgi:signal transduction histidine kinase
VRHAAGASLVTVTVRHDPRQVTVEITDDGPAAGATAARPGGYGLIGMRERVEALGRTLQAGPVGHDGPGETGGWTVRATLPHAALAAAPQDSRRAGP